MFETASAAAALPASAGPASAGLVATRRAPRDAPALPPGSLPGALRCLFVSRAGEAAAGLRAALAADSATRVDLEVAASPAAAIERLAAQDFDAAIVRHAPPHCDAPEWVAALRAGGADEPVVVWGSERDADLAPRCYEVDADAYVSDIDGTTRGLLWLLARAIERRGLRRANARFELAEARRLEHEQRETERLLADQARLAERHGELAAASAASETGSEAASEAALVDSLRVPYRDLLRAHVMMGFGAPQGEIASLAEAFAGTGASPRAIWRLHAESLAELARGLGNRSARQTIARADLLAIELLLRLSDLYLRRS